MFVSIRFLVVFLIAGNWCSATLRCHAQTLPNVYELTIRYALIENNAYNRKYKLPGPMKKVRHITIHNTAEPFSARQERDRVDFRRDKKSVSFHFAVDENEAVQILPLYVHGWHAGDGTGNGNTSSIGIEICRSACRGATDELYRKAEANAVLLTAVLLKRYHLDVKDLRMHQNWSGKFCPHRILEEKRWEKFSAAVADALNSEIKVKKINGLPPPSPTDMEAVSCERDRKSGQVRWKSFHGEIASSPAELAEKLKARKVCVIGVSAWERDTDDAAAMEELKRCGLEVKMFFAPTPGAPDWLRRNLAAPSAQ